MEEGRNELEFDEFEKLLCEIPNATSGNQHSEESGPKRVSSDDNLSDVYISSCIGPFNDKIKNNGSLNMGNLSQQKIQQSPIKRVQLGEVDQPNDQCLASAFAELSYNEASSSPLSNYKSLLNHTVLLDGQFPSSFRKTNPNMDARVMDVPSFQSPNNVPYVTKIGQESSNVSKLDAQEMKSQQIGYCHPIDSYSGSFPLAHGMQGFPYLSNVPVAGVEFPLMSDQQYYMDRQSPLPYLHSEQLNQPQISMHQQCLWLQQLLRLDGQNQVQANGNIATRLLSRNPRQPHFEMSISHQHEQSSQELLWNNYAFPRSLSQSNPGPCSRNSNAVHVPDKLGKQSFPEKILTRSHGLNTLKAVKFGSVGGHESLNNVNQNGKLLPNGHFPCTLSTLDAGCFQTDASSPWGSYPDTPNLKSIDLRSPSQTYNSVDEVTGRILLLAKDQHGCRFLQRKFSEGSPKDVEKIFLEIIDHIVELMTDPFGNYLVQKLLEVCDEDQRMQILRAVTRKPGDLVRISCDIHGTRAVQNVIETLKTPEQISMVVSSLRPDIIPLMKNPNGNHVAQRCLLYLMPEYSEFLFEAASANCVELATDRHGCCVLQKCLSHSEGEQRRRLICEISANALVLSQDPFGNYVVQFVFDLRLPWATEDILDHLVGNFGDLSMQKYSSNVVEKCLKCAGEERRARIIRELINNPRLDHIMQDPYGNYVIQAALNQSKGALQAALVDAIRPLVPVLRTSPYGKKVLSSNSLKK